MELLILILARSEIVLDGRDQSFPYYHHIHTIGLYFTTVATEIDE